jgi:hypothetical protein
MAAGARRQQTKREKTFQDLFEVEKKTQTEHISQSYFFWRRNKEYVGRLGSMQRSARELIPGEQCELSTCCADVGICDSSNPVGLHYICSALSLKHSNSDYV